MSKHGGKRKGAGRPAKADEVKLIENMDAVLAPTEVWEKLAAKVMEKDTSAIKTWLEYRYGKPKQTIENDINVKTKGNVPISKWLDDATSTD